jgi:peptidoglycan/LPS O-acetylase OafA/YrhL
MTSAPATDPDVVSGALPLESQSVRVEIGYIVAIEGLRGVAVLWVILFHYLLVRDPAAHDPWNAWIGGIEALRHVIGSGYLGVDLFFLITGFLLVLPWFRHAREGRAPPSIGAFYVRRIRRIVPAYYVQLALLFLLLAPAYYGFGEWRYDTRFVAVNLLAHLSFLHYSTPYTAASLSVNGPLWSLGVEAQYYLVLPFLALLFVRARIATALALIAIAAAWRFLASADMAWLVDAEMRIGPTWSVTEAGVRNLLATQLPGWLAHFAVGVLAGHFWLASRGKPVSRHASLAWLASAGAAFVFVCAVQAESRAATQVFAWLAAPVALGVAMVGLVMSPLASGTVLLGNPVLQFVGRVSYSAYLYHYPLLLLWNKYGPALGWPTLPLYLAVLFGVAWLSYRFVERAFMSARGAPGRHATHSSRGST